DTYFGVIYPVENAADEEIPPKISKVVLFPPRSRRASGRRKEIRYPSTGEIPSFELLSGLQSEETDPQPMNKVFTTRKQPQYMP
ncbi:unnamed protein product, partial [Thlaspi arvense]